MEPIIEFWQRKYLALPGLLREPVLSSAYKHAIERAAGDKLHDDAQVPNTPAFEADPLMERLLVAINPLLEEVTHLQLYPTYSYLRVYKRGDVLARHIDRSSCEITVSVSLGYDAKDPWPLWIEGPCGTVAFRLHPGDAAVYRGIDCYHWREPFEGEHAAQVFLHYVDQQGPHAAWKYDKRTWLDVWRRRNSQ